MLKVLDDNADYYIVNWKGHLIQQSIADNTEGAEIGFFSYLDDKYLFGAPSNFKNEDAVLQDITKAEFAKKFGIKDIDSYIKWLDQIEANKDEY